MTNRETLGGKTGKAPPLPADLLLRQYLVRCCSYYWFGESLVTDGVFDRDAQELARRWSEVRHEHKRLVDIEALRGGGTGFYIQYPQRVINAAQHQIRLNRR